MKTIIKYKAHIHKDRFGGELCAKSCDMSEYGDVYIGSVDVDIEFDMPSEKEILTLTVAALKKQKSDIEATAYIQAKAIQDKIDSLLCLEYTPEVQP